MSAPPISPLDSIGYRLPDLALLRFEGPETRAFLNSQLTQDLSDQPVGSARLAGYCSPKGRLLGSGWLLSVSSDVFMWIVSADLAAALHKRLSMFILRAKTKATLVQDLAVVGAWRSASEVQPPAGDHPILLSQWQGIQGFALAQARPDYPSVRWMGFGPVDGFQEMPADLLARWNREELLSAVPRITAQASDLFVPQAINFELVGGVSFTKGCYPGQEVVARSQYLGKMKRRLALGLCAGEVAVAQDVQDLESGMVVGQVVMAQSEVGATGTRCWIAFEVETAALDQPLGVGAHSITVQPLPYTIPVHTPVQRPKL